MVEHFSILKHSILNGLCEVFKNLWMSISKGGLESSLIQILQNIISWQLVEIYNSLKSPKT